MINPHGKHLVNCYSEPEETRQLVDTVQNGIDLVLDDRQRCDVESILNGAYSPLDGFLSEKDYNSVVNSMRLTDGTLWPIPVILDVDEATASKISIGDTITLLDQENALVALLSVTDLWQPDKLIEAEHVFGMQDTAHPGVDRLFNQTGSVYLGGRLRGIETPVHYDFVQHRYTPARLRQTLKRRQWTRVIAFQTSNPLHQVHVALIDELRKQEEANVIINPALCVDDSTTIDSFTVVRSCEEVMRYFPEQTTMLALTAHARRFAGPREALWHAIIKQNYGFSHIIFGAGYNRVRLSDGNLAWSDDDVWKCYQAHQNNLEISAIQAPEMVYNESQASVMRLDQVGDGETVLRMDNNTFYARLELGQEIPHWYSFPEVVACIRQSFPPRNMKGFTVFFTGLSGSGKSTLAKALSIKMRELGGRSVSLLDGDVVRQNLSSELGFSKHDRNLNIIRIGFVASEIARAGGIAICAPIAPYSNTRDEVRSMVTRYGGFIEIHVSTPLEICEKRDRKGLYARARKGLIKEFTGISDPYEIPPDPDMRIDTTHISATEAVNTIILKLEHLGYI